MDVGIPSGMQLLLGKQNFERLFVISWENNRDCHITTPLSLKTMEAQIKGDQRNKRFRMVPGAGRMAGGGGV